MKAHFVEFFSPGTFVAEITRKPIESWDIDEAVIMSRNIKERYNAIPYGFQFITRERSPKDLDSHETERSVMYYLGGRVKTIEEVRKRADPKEKILLINMESNGYDRIVVNENSWRWTQPLGENDIVLELQQPKEEK